MLLYLIVCPLVFLAGFVDSIAGGGGLISLPAFFFAGLPAHVAIGTNKLSSTLGTSVSTMRYFKQGFVPVKMAVCSSVAALCGSLIGANLSLLISESVIRHMMIVVLPVVAFYVLKNKDFGESRQTGTLKKEVQLLISMGAGFVIGIYDGLYGPGTGTFLLLILTGLAKLPVTEASGDQPFVQCGGSDHLYYPWDRILSTGTGGSGVLHCRALHWIWYGSKQWAEDRAASGVMCAGSIIYQSIIWKLNSTR